MSIISFVISVQANNSLSAGRLLNLGRNQGTPAHFGTCCIIQNSSSWKNYCIEAAIAGKMIVPKQWETFCYSRGYSSPFSLELLVDSYSTFYLTLKGIRWALVCIFYIQSELCCLPFEFGSRNFIISFLFFVSVKIARNSVKQAYNIWQRARLYNSTTTYEM